MITGKGESGETRGGSLRFETLDGAHLTATKTAKKPAAKKPRAKATAKARTRPGARRQPETLRLRQITPSFTATDLQRSMAFYRDVLGFVIGDEWRENGELTGCEIHAGAVTFMLGQDDFAKGRDRQKGIGGRRYLDTGQDPGRGAPDIQPRGGALAQRAHDN